MPRFVDDHDVDNLRPEKEREDLIRLLSLLCGRELAAPKEASDDALDAPVDQARGAVLAEVLGDETHTCPHLTYEQLNEILLLFHQDRITEWFFRLFFFGSDPRDTSTKKVDEHHEMPPQPEAISPQQLKDGVTRFRGYALLCYGNFRYAYKRFNEARSTAELVGLLGEWARDPECEERTLKARPQPIVPIAEEGTEIEREQTWQLGYLSRAKYFEDAAKVQFLDAKQAGEDLADRLAEIEIKESKEYLEDAWDSWDRLPTDKVHRWTQDLPDLQNRLKLRSESMGEVEHLGTMNTVKYLTWDFLDIYVATSMRDIWQFIDVSGAIRAIRRNLEDLGLRWFDPTQSYETSVIDKGLVEALMLKRARATVYMAQEGETLGKDSELAATLAQGKPVIAYIPRTETAAELESLAQELGRRPVEYFTKRLRSLQASDFFGRIDNVDRVLKRLSLLEKRDLQRDQLMSEVETGQKLVESFTPFFKVISSEEEEFREREAERLAQLSKLMAAIEAVEADNRAAVLQRKHPLAFQVHLESGVANGVLVARSPKECAALLREILINDLEFNIEPLMESGVRLATVLVERETRSRFRVVTSNKTLTNSFWNFYNASA